MPHQRHRIVAQAGQQPGETVLYPAPFVPTEHHELVISTQRVAQYAPASMAAALPIARAHRIVGTLFVDENDFPREALLEAVMRYVEADLDRDSS